MTNKEINCEKCFHKDVCEKRTCAECGGLCDECEIYHQYDGKPNILNCEDFVDADIINRQRTRIKELEEIRYNSDNQTYVQEVEWHDIRNGFPTDENKTYLCIEKSILSGRYLKSIYRYSNNLHKLDKYDFPDKNMKKGFYDYDGEYGYSSRDEVLFWAECPMLPEKIINNSDENK